MKDVFNKWFEETRYLNESSRSKISDGVYLETENMRVCLDDLPRICEEMVNVVISYAEAIEKLDLETKWKQKEII